MKPVYSVMIRRGDAEHVLNFPFTSRRCYFAQKKKSWEEKAGEINRKM